MYGKNMLDESFMKGMAVLVHAQHVVAGILDLTT